MVLLWASQSNYNDHTFFVVKHFIILFVRTPELFFYVLFLKFVCYKMKSDIQDPSINCSIFKVVWLAVKTNHNLYYVSKHLFQIILHSEIILTDKLLLISCWDCKYKITKLHYQSDESYSNAIDQLNFNISIIILHVTAAYNAAY